MLYQKEKEELALLLKTGHPLIYIVTADERPVVHILKQIIEEMKEEREYELRTWDRYQYLYNEKDGHPLVLKQTSENGKDVPFKDPIRLLSNIRTHKKDIITVLHDFHHLYDSKNDKDREILRAIKNITYDASMPFTSDYTLKRYKNMQDKVYKHTIITSPVLHMPKEMEKLAYVVEFGLPGKEEIKDILKSMEKETELTIKEEEIEPITNALLGLTETEVFYSIKKSMKKNQGKLISKELLVEKKQILKKSELVEYVNSEVKVSDVGGMKELMKWVNKRKLTFDDQFREQYQLGKPKGLLLTGVQGCGKSFAVKAIANDLELPLLRLDMGSLMSKWVGESDQNLRQAIKLVETISPCVLWIDEIEKSMPNNQGNSHETTQRMFGNILTWLQEKQSMVFVVATSNNIKNLPPELLRKGRFDEIFFVDLPSRPERKEILSIHLTKKGLEPHAYDLEKISHACEGFSGAEIEVFINESVLEAAVNKEKVTTEYILNEIEQTNPMSVTMKEQIQEIREWAIKQNVRQVSDEPTSYQKKIGF